jgi:uncharacterized protein (TIGR02246 family)
MKSIWAAAIAALVGTAAWADEPQAGDVQPSDAKTGEAKLTKEECEAKLEAPKLTPEQIQASKEHNTAAIKELTDNLAKAFNAKDAKAASELFTEKAVLINPEGKKASGRAEIEQQIGADLNGLMKDSTTSFTNVEVQFLRPGLAFVDMDSEMVCTNTTGTQPTLPKIHVSGVVERHGGKWLFDQARPATYLPPKPVSMR